LGQIMRQARDHTKRTLRIRKGPTSFTMAEKIDRKHLRTAVFLRDNGTDPGEARAAHIQRDLAKPATAIM